MIPVKPESTTVVKAACPHDCPDTCAMLVSVDGEGRAVGVVATGLQMAVDRYGGESVLPYSYAGTMGALQRDSMSARVMHALGASRLVRTGISTRCRRGATTT